MWTDRHQTRHETRLKDVVMQAGLDEVARFLERADPPARPNAKSARRVMAAVAWHLRTGGGWRALPDGFLRWRTVYGWFRRWVDTGLFAVLMRSLVRRQRRCRGRRPTPRLAIIDTQSVKCIGVRGPRGYDAAKRVVGRKRVIMVDAEGHILAMAVVPANVQDCDTLSALDEGKPHWPSLRLGLFDSVFRAKRCEEWCNLHGMRRRVVQKDPDQKGFVVLERRWVVERTFGWLSHWGGLLRERARRLATSMAATKTGDLVFIVTERGGTFTKESFGTWFRKVCREAGVPGAAHGLRKAGARRAAEAGATEAQLNALYGWAPGSRESAT